MTFDLARVRADLPSVQGVAYLNAGTFGPMPRCAAEAMHAHTDDSFERGRIGMAGIDRWFGLMEQSRRAFAPILHASPDEIALMHCTSDGCNTVVWGLPWEAGDEVVTTTHEHPGLTAPLEELARTRGVVIRTVEPTLEAIVGAVGPRTRLVAFSHVLWTHGDVLPTAEITAAVRDRVGEQAFVLIDGAQSVGVIDVQPAQLGVDAYTVSGQKWLCGPSGTGALWVRPEALGRLGTPWPWYLSKQRGPTGVSDWTTARRLDTSTIGMTSMAGLVPALEWHHAAWGNGGREYAAALADSLRAKLSKLPGVELWVVDAPSLLISFKVEGHSAAQVSKRLEAKNVLVRPIPGVEVIRASVGFWNDASDIDRLVDAVFGVVSGE